MTERRPILCIYHRDCADGHASAWAVHRKFGDAVEFVAAKYGDLPPMDKVNPSGAPYTRDVLIVDFSYPRAVLEAMARQARSVLVLDHHATAAEQLAGLPTPKFLIGTDDDTWENWIDAKLPDGMVQLAAIFDMNRSGAGLTWDYLHQVPPFIRQIVDDGRKPDLSGLPMETDAEFRERIKKESLRPRLIDLVEDRDLWKFDHDPDTRRFHAVAASCGFEITPENLARWDYWNTYCVQNNKAMTEVFREQGEAILRYEAKLVDGIVSGTRRTIRLAGHVVPLAYCPGALASEVGNQLMKEAKIITPAECDKNCDDPECPYLHTEHRSGPPFSATYYDGSDGRRHFSLRSTDASPFHCGDAARALGERFGFNGGGHKNAAGFDAPLGWEGE